MASMINARGILVVWLSAVLLIAVCTRARADDTPQIDCAMVRAKVAEFWKARALAWAIEQGYGWASIREARKWLISPSSR
jgi:hypothetical protein